MAVLATGSAHSRLSLSHSELSGKHSPNPVELKIVKDLGELSFTETKSFSFCPKTWDPGIQGLIIPVNQVPGRHKVASSGSAAARKFL